MHRFEDKVALVTGAGSGIGRAVALALVGEGARVALVGRDIAKLRDTRSSLPPERTLVLPANHERESDTQSAVAQTIDTFGGLDVLINNAGEYTEGTAAETSADDWRRGLEVNLSGPFLLTRAALPALRRAHAGVIINVASTLALRPIAGALPYCVAKAGLVMLTQATAVEEAPHGVRAIVVCPGVVDTPIHARRTGDSPEEREVFLRRMGRLHLLGRVGRPEEIAALILFLASDASAWTTGSVVTIDGGISLT